MTFSETIIVTVFASLVSGGTGFYFGGLRQRLNEQGKLVDDAAERYIESAQDFGNSNQMAHSLRAMQRAGVGRLKPKQFEKFCGIVMTRGCQDPWILSGIDNLGIKPKHLPDLLLYASSRGKPITTDHEYYELFLHLIGEGNKLKRQKPKENNDYF